MAIPELSRLLYSPQHFIRHGALHPGTTQMWLSSHVVQKSAEIQAGNAERPSNAAGPELNKL
jgi:hypothetical protein